MNKVEGANNDSEKKDKEVGTGGEDHEVEIDEGNDGAEKENKEDGAGATPDRN